MQGLGGMRGALANKQKRSNLGRVAASSSRRTEDSVRGARFALIKFYRNGAYIARRVMTFNHMSTAERYYGLPSSTVIYRILLDSNKKIINKGGDRNLVIEWMEANKPGDKKPPKVKISDRSKWIHPLCSAASGLWGKWWDHPASH